MHPSSFENMRRCIDWYGQAGPIRVADLGSAGVNGTYRELFGPQTAYTGYDLQPGPNVDIVLEDPYRLPLAENSVDLVVSGQMLEHCPHFWRVFTEVERILAPSGLAFMIAPSAGPIHRYPVDCYRFYPDAWNAAAEWSGLRLVHCWLDERGPWRDLVGVFQKGGILAQITAPHERQAAAIPVVDHLDSNVERGYGSRSYLDVLRLLHETLNPQLYIEIGVRKGKSLALSRRRTIAVDPAPEVETVGENVELFECTSDDFFFFHAQQANIANIDLAFIDGMHQSDFVYRDFINIERLMAPGGCIVIDDVFPAHPAQASRVRQSRYWTGDVWKFVQFLRKVRPDLNFNFLNTFPSGLLLISNLDPNNLMLWDNYNPYVRKLLEQPDLPVPFEVINRTDAITPSDDAVNAIFRR